MQTASPCGTGREIRSGRKTRQFRHFLGSRICRPRYMPVLRSTWCGRRSSPEILVLDIGGGGKRIGGTAETALHRRGLALWHCHREYSVNRVSPPDSATTDSGSAGKLRGSIVENVGALGYRAFWCNRRDRPARRTELLPLETRPEATPPRSSARSNAASRADRPRTPASRPERLIAAMRHGSLDGGKRLRPLLRAPGGGSVRRCRPSDAFAAGARGRAGPLLFADPRRPAGDGRRRPPPRPPDRPQGLRRGDRDPCRRRAADPRLRPPCAGTGHADPGGPHPAGRRARCRRRGRRHGRRPDARHRRRDGGARRRPASPRCRR